MSRTIQKLALALGILWATGCGSTTNPLGLFPEGQQLLTATKVARNTTQDPLPLPRELDKVPAPPYVVEPGDVLLVQPGDLDSPVRIPGDQPILPDGTINLGSYGRLQVANRTIEDVELMVNQVVKAKTPKAGFIGVRIVSRQSKVFYVLGEVNAPGTFPLQGRETVLDAILTAGGVNTRANLKGVTLSRPTQPQGCRVVIPICYEEIVQLGDTSTNYQIQAGDRIFIPTKGLMDNLKNCCHKECLPCGRAQIPCTALGQELPPPCASTWNSPPPAHR